MTLATKTLSHFSPENAILYTIDKNQWLIDSGNLQPFEILDSHHIYPWIGHCGYGQVALINF